MSPRWALHVLLVTLPLFAAAGLLQSALDSTPERTWELSINRLQDLSVSGAAIESTGALLMGGFKALAVDYLWVRLGDLMRDRQWIEAVQVAELITKFQPRSETVWSLLVKDLMYNIPANLDDREEKWSYIRRGLAMGREGTNRNPQSPYIWFEMGFSVSHRLSQDEFLMERYQREFGESPFRGARTWYGRSQDALKARMREQWYVSESGLVISSQMLDAFVRETSLQEAGWALLRDDDTATAAESLYRALGIVQVHRKIHEIPGGPADPFQLRLERCIGDLIAAVGVHREYKALYGAGSIPGSRDKLLELWRAYGKAILNPSPPEGVPDTRPPEDRSNRMDHLDRAFFIRLWRLIGGPLGVDRHEPNDLDPYWSQIDVTKALQPIEATIAPDRDDVDRYFYVPPADGRVRFVLRWKSGELSPAVRTGHFVGTELKDVKDHRWDPSAGVGRLEEEVKAGVEHLLQVWSEAGGPWSAIPYLVEVSFEPSPKPPGPVDAKEGTGKPPDK